LPSTACVDPFLDVTAFRHKPATFCAYSNGKSFGRLRIPDLRSAGVHHFVGGSTYSPSAAFVVPPHVAVVLHYESSSYAVSAAMTRIADRSQQTPVG
jgi:hypothetical protein